MRFTPPNKPLHILLAEDDNDDQVLFTEALAALSLPYYQLSTVNDGDECISFLLKKGKFRNSEKTLPDFIVLDINMPKLDGVEVLKKFKEITELEKVPVFVLSTTSESKTCEVCKTLGCVAYYKKPTNINDLRAIVAEMFEKFLALTTR